MQGECVAKCYVNFVHQNDPDKASNMPRDGTVHELTSHVSHGALRSCVCVV